MTIDLQEYRPLLEEAAPEVRETFEASFAEAAHVMSATGLKNYLEGAKALCELGRGTDLVVSYLDAMPAVAKEVGEEVVPECVTAALKLASMVSGAVIAELFSSMPVAARRFGDAELVRSYLGLIHSLSAKVPRGLRPMLEHLDMLLSKLTLGGLRRWANWGAQAHGRDFAAQTQYFALESADSQSVLQNERRGLLFVDLHRRLNFYLRALWGRDFFLRPTSGDYESREGYRPYVEHAVIHLPDAYDDYGGITGGELYRAAAAHAAAHLMYATGPISAEALNPSQMAFIGLIEDARIEALAIAEFPGLKQLWGQFFRAMAEVHEPAHPALGYMERAAHALLDDAHQDEDPVIGELARRFREEFERRPQDNQLSWDLGVDFYNRIQDQVSLPSARVLEQIGIPYRDDNRIIWQFAENVWDETVEYAPATERQVRRTVSVIEMANELDCELAGDDAQEIWRLETPFYLDQEECTINELEGTEPVSQPYHYPEWDYQIQLSRPDWVTVLERRQPKGDPAKIDAVLDEYKPLASRIKHVIDSLQPEGVVRLRRQESGDDIDLDAAISAMIDLRMGQTPDPRINLRHIRKTRDLAVLVLLDLSESTNETLPDSDRPVIQLTREAAALLSWAIDGIGDPFAVHGFASDGRHDVHYYRFKEFDEPYDDKAKERLAGMEGGLSTRMGAALRHGASYLSKRPQQKKLLLLVSDGEPSDIDVRDPQHLRHDTKKAVEELATRGIFTYCLTLDSHADEYVSRIFGPRGYSVVDHVNRLPERLPAVFVGLTK